MENEIYFCSDYHFNHFKSNQFCNRGFSSNEEMNEALIENWNQHIPQKSTVYYLGDFGFGGLKILRSIFDRLNGSQKFLIKGNHDKKQVFKLNWTHTYNVKGIRIDNQYIWLSHFPHASWNISYHGSYHLFGHVHSNGNYWSNGLSCDVGYDFWKRPIHYSEVFELLKIVKENVKHNYFLWRGNPFKNNIKYIYFDEFDKE